MHGEQIHTLMDDILGFEEFDDHEKELDFCVDQSSQLEITWYLVGVCFLAFPFSKYQVENFGVVEMK